MDMELGAVVSFLLTVVTAHRPLLTFSAGGEERIPMAPCTEIVSEEAKSFVKGESGEPLEPHPDFSVIPQAVCSREGGPCFGMAEGVRSSCETNETLISWPVRRFGSRGEYRLRPIRVPGACLCWIRP